MLFTLRPSNLRSVSHNIVQTYPYSISDGHLLAHTSFKHPITKEFRNLLIQLSHCLPPLSGCFSMTIENSNPKIPRRGIQVVKPEIFKEC